MDKSLWTRLLLCGEKKKKTRGLHSHQEKKQLTAKAAWIIFSEVHGELILMRDNSFNVDV